MLHKFEKYGHNAIRYCCFLNISNLAVSTESQTEWFVLRIRRLA